MSASDAAIAPVVFAERETRAGLRIGVATLNAPRTLNGLSLDMARRLDARLRAWAVDAGIALVLLEGAGEKAFCAGGDLQALYRSMRECRERGSTGILDNAYAADFFATEYRLDHRIHTYPKPILCRGHGIVMGGGIGLMAGASHRVVDERSKLAFPEITVGLYPDVGGSRLLGRVPHRAGLFVALTGAPLDAGDAIHAGLADRFVPQAATASMLADLPEAPWTGDAEADRRVLDSLLARHAAAPRPGPLQRHRDAIEAACAHAALEDVVAAIGALDASDPWVAAAQRTLAAGSPGSARLGHLLQGRAAALSLADTFRLEYVASLHCCAHGDFEEGIRALLIDKDRAPRWQPATLAEADAAWAETFLVAPAWPDGAHPLADLGTTTETST